MEARTGGGDERRRLAEFCLVELDDATQARVVARLGQPQGNARLLYQVSRHLVLNPEIRLVDEAGHERFESVVARPEGVVYMSISPLSNEITKIDIRR